MRFVRFATAAVVLIAALGFARHGAVAATEVSAFITDRATQVLRLFDNPSLTPQQREDRLHAIAVDAFDVPAIARSVMGRYWTTMTDTERGQFTTVFEHHMVHVYAARFGQYHNVRFSVIGERAESPTRTVVHSHIGTPDRQTPVNVDWWITKAGAGYKIIDVSIEGVSQILTYREEFATYIQRNGGHVSALIDRLRSMTEG